MLPGLTAAGKQQKPDSLSVWMVAPPVRDGYGAFGGLLPVRHLLRAGGKRGKGLWSRMNFPGKLGQRAERAYRKNKL